MGNLKRAGNIVDIRECRDAGIKKAATARRLNMDRGTVSKYWEGPVQDVTPPRYQRRTLLIEPYQDYITSRLETYPELTAEQLFRAIREQGYTGSERSVRRFVATIRPRRRRVYKPMEVLPGEQAQVDWGHFGSIVHHGHRVKLYALVVALSWSRAMYVEFITSLNTATFAGGLHRALAYFDAVPTEILFDNAKTVVSERIGSIVQFNGDLLQLAIRYGFTPKACWVADPESKGRVESNVKYVRSSFFYGLEFGDLDELNQAVRRWLDDVANVRTHGTTGLVPAEQLEEERASLRPFPAGAGPSGVLEDRLVSKDGLIRVDHNAYSVPSDLQRQSIRIRRFEQHIEVLDKGTVVHRHTLLSGRGQRVVLDEHYPKRAEQSRPHHPLQAKFEELCPQAKTYLEGLSRAGSGSLREQMERIVELNHTYDSESIAAAMGRSLHFGAFGYGRLKRILQRQSTAPTSLVEIPPEQSVVQPVLGAGSLQRDPSWYAEVGS